MQRTEASRASVVGYLLVLFGGAGWIVSCFLPLYRIPSIGGTSTLYRQVSFGSDGVKVGGWLYLFGGIVAIGIVSIVGLRRNQRLNGAVLTGAALVWLLVMIGVLITLASNTSLNHDWSLAVGYWCLWASVACVAAGGVIVVAAVRRSGTEEGTVPA